MLPQKRNPSADRSNVNRDGIRRGHDFTSRSRRRGTSAGSTKTHTIPSRRSLTPLIECRSRKLSVASMEIRSASLGLYSQVYREYSISIQNRLWSRSITRTNWRVNAALAEESYLEKAAQEAEAAELGAYRKGFPRTARTETIKELAAQRPMNPLEIRAGYTRLFPVSRPAGIR